MGGPRGSYSMSQTRGRPSNGAHGSHRPLSKGNRAQPSRANLLSHCRAHHTEVAAASDMSQPATRNPTCRTPGLAKLNQPIVTKDT